MVRGRDSSTQVTQFHNKLVRFAKKGNKFTWSFSMSLHNLRVKTFLQFPLVGNPVKQKKKWF